MAKDDDDLDLDVEGGKKKGGGKLKLILIISLIIILLVGLSITVTLLLLGDNSAPTSAAAPASSPTTTQAPVSAEAEATAEAVSSGTTAYMDLAPAFVVNLEGRQSDIRYLQISVSVQVNRVNDIELIKKHMPVVRHNLNLLFSSLDFNEIRSREGKSKLTEEALQVIRKAMTDAAGQPVVQAVFFNSIVGQ